MAKKSTDKNQLPDVIISKFFGLNTAATNPDDLTPGTSQNALNWITGAVPVPGKQNEYYGDHIELRRGSIPIAAQPLPTGSVSGLGVGIMQNGTQVPFFSVGQHVYYYNSVTEAIAEVSSIQSNSTPPLLPALAANDDVAIIPYQNVADYAVLLSSPHSSIYKIVVADPANAIDFQSFSWRGFITTSLGRTYLWNETPVGGVPNTTSLYLSYTDGSNAAQNPPFIPTTGVQGLATNGTQTAFTDTLSVNANANIFGINIAGPVATPVNITDITVASQAVVSIANTTGFVIGSTVQFAGVVGMTQINNLIGVVTSVTTNTSITVSISTLGFTAYNSGGTVTLSELFIDDQNGNLSSNLGGTGTINYATGVYSLTFNTPPVSGQYLAYAFLNDEPLDSGPVDFSNAAPSHPGDPIVFSQPGFGPLQNVFTLSGLYFCFHSLGVYQIQIVQDSTYGDSTSTPPTQAPYQQVYAQNVGMPYWRAGYATGDGILYMDIYNFSYPTMRQLVLDYGQSSTTPLVIPESLSDAMNWSDFTFTKSAIQEWGDYYVVACQASENGVPNPTNNQMFVMNKKTGYWDMMDFRASCMATYYGALLAGDPISPNLQVLFSGFDDNGFNINNYWQSAPSALGQFGTKSYNRFRVKGLIAPSQTLQIAFSFDGSSYVTAATIVGNSSPYVNQGTPIEVGGPTVGSNIVGGGGTTNAYPFEAELELPSDFFNRVSVQFSGPGVGYLSIQEYGWLDIRIHSRELPSPSAQ